MRHGIVLFFVIALALSVAFADVKYDPPEGGWTYKYDGVEWDPDANYALDGLWSHENGSDAWDGTEIGDGIDGGTITLVEAADGDTTTFLRIQDPGDPRQYGESDPSNRKIYLGYDITLNDAPGNDLTLLDDGITISFRARVAVPKGDDIDDLNPADGSGPDVWPETGDGYLVHDGGKGNFSVHQSGGGTISFCLAVKTDHPYLEMGVDSEGLVMNRKTGNVLTSDVNWQGFGWADSLEQNVKDSLAATTNFLPLDPREWHEFWITIEGVVADEGTHLAKIYVDGSTEPDEFIVTAGSGSDYDNVAYLAMGCGATPQSGCYDVDFYAYKPGLFVPTGSSAVEHKDVTLPAEFSLYQNYPNPFNPTTTINYQLERDGFVSLKVYDHLGRTVSTLVSEQKSAAFYSVDLNAQNLTSGLYFYELVVDNKLINTKKMLVIK